MSSCHLCIHRFLLLIHVFQFRRVLEILHWVQTPRFVFFELRLLAYLNVQCDSCSRYAAFFFMLSAQHTQGHQQVSVCCHIENHSLCWVWMKINNISSRIEYKIGIFQTIYWRFCSWLTKAVGVEGMYLLIHPYFLLFQHHTASILFVVMSPPFNPFLVLLSLFMYTACSLHGETVCPSLKLLRDLACWSVQHCGFEATGQSSCVEALLGLKFPPVETSSPQFTPSSPQEWKHNLKPWLVWKV